MVAAVAVQNINGINCVKFMLFGIGAVSLCNTRVKAAAKECRQSRFFKFFAVSPLPAVVKVSGKSGFLTAFFINGAPLWVIGIFRFIVGGIHVINTAGKAGIHNC